MPSLTQIDDVATPAQKSPRSDPIAPGRRHRYARVAAFVLAAAAAIGAVVAWQRLFPPPAASAITASGRIEGREVTLAPKDIQARVKHLWVDEGQGVKAGQVLAELESAQLEARYQTLDGNLAALDAQIDQATLDVEFTAKNSDATIAAARAAVSSAQARLAGAQAVRDDASADYQRDATLLQQGIVAAREADHAQMLLRTSDADLDAAGKELARAEANLALANAGAAAVGLKRQQVRALQQSRRAALGQRAEAQANLADRQLLAPADGVVLSRTVEVGDFVSPGTPVFQIVDLNRLYVKVYIPEPQIGRLRLGDPADVYVDAFPGHPFVARISRIHDQAEFTPKNVETAEERLKLVFGVELAIANADGVLKPGMPADCVIHDSGRHDASEGPHGS